MTDGLTDRQTDEQTPHNSINRACIASRGKNASQHVPVYLQQFPSYSNHNCKKSPFLRTPAFIFCLPWGRPCGNHAKRCINEKTIQCLPNSSQHVPIYLQQFPSFSNCKCKKSPFSQNTGTQRPAGRTDGQTDLLSVLRVSVLTSDNKKLSHR